VPRQLPRVDLRSRALRLDAAPPVTVDAAEESDLALVLAWMTRLHLLYGVPFNYLVPDERMLPAESLRFFRLDDNWMDALLDGAYSIGFAGAAEPTSQAARSQVMAAARVATPRVRQDVLAASRTMAAAASTVARDEPSDSGGGPVSGFLLRSAVVAGWPGVEVRGWADAAGTQPLALLRLETVAPSLLLCLFDGVAAAVELREPAEALHFGVEAAEGGWQKATRYAAPVDGHAAGDFTGVTVGVPLRSAETGVVDVSTLATVLGGAAFGGSPPENAVFTAAEFGLEMVEGVQVVRFRADG
jgi:hypothetical protein